MPPCSSTPSKPAAFARLAPAAKAETTRSISAWSMTFGVNPQVSTADGAMRSGRFACLPAWWSCSTAGTPRALMAAASRASPGMKRSSEMRSVRGLARPRGSTVQFSTTTIPAPESASSE